MWTPMLALILLESSVEVLPREPLPDRALLEFLAEFEVVDPKVDADLDPLWLVTPDAAAELDKTPEKTPETDTDAENADERPR